MMELDAENKTIALLMDKNETEIMVYALRCFGNTRFKICGLDVTIEQKEANKDEATKLMADKRVAASLLGRLEISLSNLVNLK